MNLGSDWDIKSRLIFAADVPEKPLRLETFPWPPAPRPPWPHPIRSAQKYFQKPDIHFVDQIPTHFLLELLRGPSCTGGLLSGPDLI